ncbi:hypothetical protein PHYBLDRAFT_159764 [Phycomyces blakesleeanus NRRL 1555(-)]|uniref:Histone deacetylase interacting domain-containing protein n=2 Tax=Phycomyces blakesleeanus TaxID=4837 RepID=A0A167L2R1_PHYB8|nr:hypothetical protein PHYBLDRAFT_159764 [Phycomyces blakesleeanus NRRL 1555(-)]OAD69456.1 hypothetical protein PHYBLDRAFT_159764 [Phycomyces blakesleeanus NRRL 1555(-)]|eukprot:XP_018287496.1 hypothetical protein PHYBLDRAFT_159764 [Phycomyces blakesleeanus NRRL 1555(-)]
MVSMLISTLSQLSIHSSTHPQANQQELYTTNSITQMSSQEYRRSWKSRDAPLYIDLLKSTFSTQPYNYNRFLDIMMDYKRQMIDTLDMIERVLIIFQGNPSLISGFNIFLPLGYSMEPVFDGSQSTAVLVTTPSGHSFSF